ncbi:HNH endonuclease [Flavobacterium tyrosinilyticum]|uniref:HNH endonuclease n=1 Tax=Flavobacterium tyrosinilyticum TaxID=1658740 RepID=UPI0020301679|nr:HNH endonuclease [Flavobacterium tyrosinilyticum]MCM0666389.1 HNH endonuclease [Flavobacterium tyrosinilyticum]
MNKEQQNRFLILFALKNLNYNASKNEVLNFILENNIIILNENDFKNLPSRTEEKWRNELAFVRSHLVKEDYLTNSNKDKWEVTNEGKIYLDELSILVLQTQILIRINKPEIISYNVENRSVVNAEREIQKVKSANSLHKTEKENIILSRIGQGIYRKNLIDLYKNCCLTNYELINVLIASHIKPWKFSNNFERLDKFNGLLLAPTYDKIFDLGYITFKNNGKIKISSRLINAEKLGIYENMKIKVFQESKKYLEYHRKFIFLK